MNPAKLHRIHAVPASGRGGASFDVGSPVDGIRWRAESGGPGQDVKRAVAFRLALCWNLCEGIPTAELQAGHLRELMAAIDELLVAPAPLQVLERIRALRACVDRGVDLTAGPLHDCEPCLAREAAGEGA